MEIKNTVKTKIVKAKDWAVAFAVQAAPGIVIGVTCGTVAYITGKAAYAMGYNQGAIDGSNAGGKAVIEIISDLAKSVETK